MRRVKLPFCSESPHIRESRFPESGKFLLVKSGILGFGIRNTAQELGIQLTIGIQNPLSIVKGWNSVTGIRYPLRGIQNPRLSWIPLHGI